MRDTSDTSTDSWNSDDSEIETYRVEYEIASPRPESCDSGQTSSDPEVKIGGQI